MSEINKIWHQAEEYAPSIAEAIHFFERSTLPSEASWFYLAASRCGLVTEMLRQQFAGEGISSHAVINRLANGTRFADHVLLAVENGDETFYIDANYLQFFAEFGLDVPLIVESWKMGHGDILPKDHTLVYTADQLGDLTDWLTGQTIHLLSKWQHSEPWRARYQPGQPLADIVPQTLPDSSRVRQFFEQIYNPVYFEPFEQTPAKQLQVTQYLDKFQPQNPEHVLV